VHDEEHDEELVSAALGGDGDAFGALVERHRRDALRVAYGIADGEADDVAQDAFVKAFRNLGQFRTGASFRAWLLAIVANEARNRRRSFLRRNALVLRVCERPILVGADDPEASAVRWARRQVLADAMARLPDRDREVLALRYFAELSEVEMAAGLGCAPGTVKSRLSRAMGVCGRNWERSTHAARGGTGRSRSVPRPQRRCRLADGGARAVGGR
jgi:RNA polymerase sigma-70 factor (ECF subfamily)